MSEKCKLILGDCLGKMDEMDNNSVDLILTDPPYGIGINKMNYVTSGAIKVGGAYRNDYSNSSTEWDIKGLSKNQWNEIQRVSKNQIVFGGNFYNFPISRCWVVWDKRVSEKYSNDFADCELIWTSFDKPARMIRFLYSGMIQQNMAKKEVRVHPTQKPVKVVEKLIEMFSNKGDTILDPFMGSGTTGVASLKLQRKFIGIEINPEYFEIAKKRIGEWQNQSRLSWAEKEAKKKT